MLNSMTGFGRARAEAGGREAVVELKAVNSRYLDFVFRMPRVLNPLEDRMRRRIGEIIQRGKVDISVSYRNRREDRAEVRADIGLAKSYRRALDTLREQTGLSDDLTLTALAAYPQVLSMQESEEDEEALWQVLSAALDEALEKLSGMRMREGERLQADLEGKIANIGTYVDTIRACAPDVEQSVRDRLMQKMQEYFESDENLRQRVLAEAALLADKRAIDEEIVRLNSHMEEFLHNLASAEPVGPQAGFHRTGDEQGK